MKLFAGLSKTASTMLVAVVGICLCLLVAGLLVIFLVYRFEQPLPFVLGLFAGCVLSLLKVILLNKSISRAVEMEGQQAQNYARLQSIARYFLNIVVVVGVVLFPKVIGLFGAIAGIVSLQLAAYATNILLKSEESKAR